MNLQKINWKFFFEKPEAAKPDLFFKLFNTWIPDSPEVFVDVADYSHVHDGPLTILVGHYTDYILDETGRRRGFQYSRKQPLDGTNAEKLRQTLKETLAACIRAEQDPLFNGSLKFLTEELLLIVSDRALAPNTPETFREVLPDLQALADALYGEGNTNLKYLDDPKQRFSVRVSAKTTPTLGELVTRLAKK